jgi:hypothetical protein
VRAALAEKKETKNDDKEQCEVEEEHEEEAQGAMKR